MPDTKSPINPEQIIELALKYRWFIIIPFCLSMIAGIFLAFKLPKVYSASTTILVQPQRVPTNFVQSLVSTAIEERISTIRQQIMSRTNLEKITKEFKLFSEPQHSKMYPEDKVEALQKRISVDLTRARRGTGAFSIGFEGKDPQTVMKVANSLASYFINENLKVREDQAVGTSNFLDAELNTMRKRLEDVEEKFKNYKKKFMGELPEQLQTNLSILTGLQEQLFAREESIRNARSRLLALENQSSSDRNLRVPLGGGQPVPENLANLEQIKDQLANMKTRYTEQHPDVIRLKKTIANLEAQIEGEKIELPADSQESGPAQSRTDLGTAARNQYNGINREIVMLKQDISRLHAQIQMYQKRVEETPKREQELMSLRRDYDNIQQSYDSLLSRKLEAEISVNMEKKQKGEQFRIIDPARLPEKPISPNMKKIFALSLAVGLGLGGGFLFLFYYLDSSFRESEEVEAALGVPVLVTLPKVYHPAEIRKQKFHFALSVFSIMVSFTLVAGFAVLTLKGVDQTMAFVQKFINI